MWHQHLGHPCNEFLHDAHKFITGVPKFSNKSDVLSTCPTCSKLKLTKLSTGPNTTKIAVQPYQGLSIDFFLFSGTKSNDPNRQKDFVGMNGKTAWVLVVDQHFIKMKHSDVAISKASPIVWLRHFLTQYSPGRLSE